MSNEAIYEAVVEMGYKKRKSELIVQNLSLLTD